MEVSENPRKRRHRSRSRRRNPGGLTLRRPLGAVMSGFKPDALAKALPVAAGAFANYMARRQVAKMFPVTAVGIPSYAVGIATAGLMLLIPRHGPAMFVGGLTEELLRGFNQFVMPGAMMLSGMLSNGDDDGFLSDYEQQALNDYETARAQSMNDYDTVDDLSQAGDW